MLGPDDRGVLAGILHHDRSRVLVLAGERVAGRIEFHPIAVNSAARQDVHVKRRFDAPIRRRSRRFLLRQRQQVVQQDPGLVEAHGAVRRRVWPCSARPDMDELAEAGAKIVGSSSCAGTGSMLQKLSTSLSKVAGSLSSWL